LFSLNTQQDFELTYISNHTEVRCKMSTQAEVSSFFLLTFYNKKKTDSIFLPLASVSPSRFHLFWCWQILQWRKRNHDIFFLFTVIRESNQDASYSSRLFFFVEIE